MRQIVILDDNKGRAEQRADLLKALPTFPTDCDLTALEGNEATGYITQLVERQLALREDAEIGWLRSDTPFDQADVALLDYDLAGFHGAGCATGEDLSYLVRIGTNCGAIVLMNRRDSNYFDLSMVEDYDVPADFELGSESLCTPALWGGSKIDFRPWDLRDPFAYTLRLRRLVSKIRDLGSDALLADVLGMAAEEVEKLPLRNLVAPRSDGDLDRAGTELSSPVVANILFHPDTLRSREREVFRQDKMPDETWSSVAAARLLSWLGRRVVRPQHLVLDLPHLAMLYPSLLESDVKRADLVISEGDSTPKGVHLSSVAMAQAAELSALWGRPLWWRDKLRDCASLLENREPWNLEQHGRVGIFCEDTSTFRDEDATQIYQSSLDGSYSIRYCADPAEDEDSLDEVRRLPLDALDV